MHIPWSPTLWMVVEGGGVNQVGDFCIERQYVMTLSGQILCGCIDIFISSHKKTNNDEMINDFMSFISVAMLRCIKRLFFLKRNQF